MKFELPVFTLAKINSANVRSEKHGPDELVPAVVPPRVVLHGSKFVMRWGNQTDSGQNNLPPSDDRWALRSETYPGIADAMAQQWVSAVLETA